MQRRISHARSSPEPFREFLRQQIRFKKSARIWCQKLCTFLFEVIFGFGKMCFIFLILNGNTAISVLTLQIHEKAIQVHPVVKVLLCMHNDGLISMLCKSRLFVTKSRNCIWWVDVKIITCWGYPKYPMSPLNNILYTLHSLIIFSLEST